MPSSADSQPSEAVRSPWRQLWQLQRQGEDETAWSLLERQIPFAVAQEPHARAEQRQLLDAWIAEALKRQGLEAVEARLEQQAMYGFPDGRPELEALLASSRRSHALPTAVSALLQLQVVQGPDPERQLELAENLALLGYYRPALRLCQQAVGRLSGEPRARGHQMAALLHYRQGDRRACFGHLFEAVALGSQDPVTLQFLCRLQCARGELDAATASLGLLQKESNPLLAPRELRLRLGLALAQGLAEDGLREEIAAALGGGLLEEGSEILAAIPALLEQDRELLALRDALLRQRQRQRLGDAGALAAPPPVLASAGRGKVRRLGLLAPGYAPGSDGGLALALQPWLEQQGFELQAFATLQPEGAVDTLPQAVSLAGLSSAEAADRLRSSELDALIDLCGWQDGLRHDLLRQQPAPLQLGWFAHDFSSGLSELNYLLVDRFQAPPLRQALVEGLLVLPGSFLALTEPLPALPLRADASGDLVVLAPAGRVQPQALAAWGRILRDQPQRRLCFAHPSYGQEVVWQRLLAAAPAAGIAGDRLVRCPAAEQPLAAALVLDPWPWGHWRSVLAALQQGVPVLTRQGRALHQRRSAAVLELLGLGSFVAQDEETWLAIADTLLADDDLQAQLHLAIPQQVQASLLHQPAQFAADLRQALDGVAST